MGGVSNATVVFVLVIVGMCAAMTLLGLVLQRKADAAPPEPTVDATGRTRDARGRFRKQGPE